MTLTKNPGLGRRALLGTVALATLPAQAQPQAITVAYSEGTYRPLMEETARSLESETGIAVRLRSPAANYQELLQQSLRDALTDDLADVALHGNYLVPVLARRGLAVPMDGLIASEPDWAAQGYSPALAEAGRANGKTVGLPWQISVPILFWNLTLVQRAGADPDRLPADWDGIVALVRRISAIEPQAGGFFDYLTNGVWTFQALLTAQGGRLLADDDRSVGFDGETGHRALAVIRAFADAGMVDLTQPQSQQAFAAGRLGVLASYSSLLGALERGATANGFRLGTAPWPLPSPQGRLPAGGRTIVIQSRYPTRQRAAWRYAKYMTGPQVQARLVRQFGAEPANTLAARTGLLDEYYSARPNAKTGLAATDRLTAWSSFPGENNGKIETLLRDRLREVATGRATPDEALARMVRETQALLPGA